MKVNATKVFGVVVAGLIAMACGFPSEEKEANPPVEEATTEQATQELATWGGVGTPCTRNLDCWSGLVCTFIINKETKLREGYCRVPLCNGSPCT
jgi:hypothetical protein